MAVLLYARVSTGRQAAHDLSLPAQFRLAERYAQEHGLSVAGKYQDVSSGKYLRERPGLLALLAQARRDRSIDGLVVHKIDRLARNTFNYLLLKSKLRTSGVRLYSVVETIDETPMGEFMEHIMAAQAEFYSANLASEVKKGIEEKLLRGQWPAGAPPVGYLMRQGRVVVDPARGAFMRRAFELWAEGTMTANQVAEAVYQQGLVGRSGKPIQGKNLCELLKKPFYYGLMRVNNHDYPGTHAPLISRELFERCQEVFRQKRGTGRKPRRHLTFLLGKRIRCPWCARSLTTDHHQKKSGKVYRYYRCHPPVCTYSTRAEFLEEQVCQALLKLRLPERLLPPLRRRLVQARRYRSLEQADRIRHLRHEAQRHDEELRQLAQAYATGKLTSDHYEQRRQLAYESKRATEFILSTVEDSGSRDDADSVILERLRYLPEVLRGNDLIAKRQLVENIIERVELKYEVPTITFTQVIRQLLEQQSQPMSNADGPEGGEGDPLDSSAGRFIGNLRATKSHHLGLLEEPDHRGRHTPAVDEPIPLRLTDKIS